MVDKPSGDGTDTDSLRDVLLYELKELSQSLQRDCRETMLSMGNTVVEDIQRELRKLADSVPKAPSTAPKPLMFNFSPSHCGDERPLRQEKDRDDKQPERLTVLETFLSVDSAPMASLLENGQEPHAANGQPGQHCCPRTTVASAGSLASVDFDSDPGGKEKAEDGILDANGIFVNLETSQTGHQASQRCTDITVIGGAADEDNRTSRARRDDNNFGLTHNLFHKAKKHKTKRRARMQPELARKHSITQDRYLGSINLTEVISSTRFDNAVGFVILLNAVVIGLQTEYQAVEQTEEVPLVFFIFEQLFCIWFTGELTLRLFVFRFRFFSLWQAGWLWNYFDFFVVSAQLAEIALDLIARNIEFDAKNLRVLRVLRILRLVRILRVVRVLHLISELRTIVSSISGSLKSLGWTIVLLLLLIYIVAVFFTQSVSAHLVQRLGLSAASSMDEAPLTAGELTLEDHFGSLGQAVLTLWQAMSGGIDWETLATPLIGEIGLLVGAAFVGYIAFGILALMNVVTGVFVQAALNSARKEEDAFMTDQIVTLFGMSNRPDGAAINMDEIMQSIEDPKTMKEWQSIGVSGLEAQSLFQMLDLNQEGVVPFEEFLAGCLRLNGGAKSIDLLTLMQETRANNMTMHRVLSSVSRRMSALERHQRLAQSVEEQMPMTADGGSGGSGGCSKICMMLHDIYLKLHSLEASQQDCCLRVNEFLLAAI
eukprot:TRINITY_DN24498_c0_g1_i1.p1 TRINITY_DN24498_c0_g1~~TRINITY_DN24498_c0_g1_i1.p1  ORF type:complete len:712 (+),score=183.99 TRINITY_DN24498_c0_g1_i1:81-2216(+)